MLLLLGLLLQIWLGLSWLQGFEVLQDMQCWLHITDSAFEGCTTI
jgi:hypothetical protein